MSALSQTPQRYQNRGRCHCEANGKGSDLNHSQQRGNGPPPAAERELGLDVDFGHGTVQRGQVEERVIAKAAGAARGFQNESLDRALGGVEGHAIARGHQHAAVAGGAAGRRLYRSK